MFIEGREASKHMKKLILTLFAILLACSPLIAENAGVKAKTTHAQVTKAGKKKHHKKKKGKKKAEKAAKKKTAAEAA